MSSSKSRRKVTVESTSRSSRESSAERRKRSVFARLGPGAPRRSYEDRESEGRNRESEGHNRESEGRNRESEGRNRESEGRNRESEVRMSHKGKTQGRSLIYSEQLPLARRYTGRSSFSHRS